MLMRSGVQIDSVLIAKRINLERITPVLAMAVILLGALFWADRPVTAEQTDFSVTYIGARMVYLGHGSKLYDLDEQHKLKASLLPHGEPLIYEHPPFEALLLAPLAALPYRTAYLLWGLMNIAIWLSLPWLLRPYAPVPREELGYIALWVLFAPLGVTLFQGQSSLVMLLLYSLAFMAMQRGRDFRAGVALGLGLLKFQFAVPFVVIFLLRRKWTMIKGFFATAFVLGVLSVIAVGWRGIGDYLHLLAAVASHPSNVSYGSAVDMATIHGFAHATLGAALGSSTVLLTVVGISTFLIGWTAWQWNRVDRAGDRRSSDLMFGAAIVVSLLTGLHMFTHDLSPMLLTMLLVAAHVTESHERWLRFVLLAYLTLFWMPPIYFVLLARHRMYILLTLLLIFALGTMKLAQNLKSREMLNDRCSVS